MYTYNVQHKIRVLLSNNTNISSQNPHTFTVDEVTFRPWQGDPREYWRAGEWLVEANIYAVNLEDAFKQYGLKMSRIVPRIAFVGQAYINDRMGSIFIKRDDKDFGWFRSITARDSVSLDFMDEEQEALNLLLANTDVPEAFYLYWNDAVNTTSYTGKLLLMFGAIDSFATRGRRRQKRVEILGEELTTEIYAEDAGLRNQLTHGEYLNDNDGKNYVEVVHRRVLEYFNKSIIKKDILELDIVGPQRHFDENYEGLRLFVGQAEESPLLDLRNLTKDVEENDGHPDSYEIIYDKGRAAEY